MNLTVSERQRRFSALPIKQQLREISGSKQERLFTVERATADDEERTVWMSIASDRAYERYWGIEVLDLSTKAIRVERLTNGAPILVNHDATDQVGVIDAYKIEEKKLKVLARFSRSARGEEIWRDIMDGIRRNTSVGYIIHKAVLAEKGKELNTYRVTDWEPLEGSTVSVPAYPSVGPGRSFEIPQNGAVKVEDEMQDKEQSQSTPAERVAEKVSRNDSSARSDERKRIAERTSRILEIGARWKEYGGEEVARTAIAEPDMTVEAFESLMLKRIGEQQVITRTGEVTPQDRKYAGQDQGAGSYGMSPREIVYSGTLRAFKGVGKAFGRDDMEIAYRAGMWARAILADDPRAQRWCRDSGVALAKGLPDQFGINESRVMTEGTFTSAGWLVPTEMEAGIISNREQYGIARRVCNVVPMSTATHTMPRVTSDITAYFVGENSTGTESDSSGDQVNLTLKDLMAYTRIGKSSAMDAVVSLAEYVAREQGRAFAIKEDSCLISGDGTSTYGGIQGIKTLLDTAAYAGGKYAAASGHDTFAEVDIADITGLIGILPVYARPGARFVCSGVFDAVVFGRLKLTAGGNTIQTSQGAIVEGDYAGFPISVAHPMPSAPEGPYNGSSVCIFGNLQLGVALGSGSGMMMTVDPYTDAHKNLTRIITVERIDINCHGCNKSTTVAGPIVALHGTT